MEEGDADKVLEAAARIAKEAGAKVTPASEGGEEEDLLANAVADPRKKSEPSPQVEQDGTRNDRIKLFTRLSGVGEATAHALADAGYGTIGDIIADSAEEVANKTGLSIGIARTVQIAADRYLQSELVDDAAGEDD
jgi:transcription termination/antitermination protein NusA